MRVSGALLWALCLVAFPAAAQQREVNIDLATVAAFQLQVDALADSYSPAERAAWNTLLARAASAPRDDPTGAAVRPGFSAPGAANGVLMERIEPTSAAIAQGSTTRTMSAPAGRSGIIVQGGRGTQSGIIVQGGRGARSGIIVQGGRTAVGPQIDADPQLVLQTRLTELAAQLDPSGRAALDWLLQRAAAGTGDAGAVTPTLREALGITADAGPERRWVLRC